MGGTVNRHSAKMPINPASFLFSRPGSVSRIAVAALLLIVYSKISAARPGVDPVKREITIGLTTEPPSLNTIASTDAESGRILNHITEGLTGYDAQRKLVGAVAERWELTDEGATFWLRKDALWDDGVSVTAHDFVFAWRKVVEPASASEYAYLLYPIVNAEKINTGKLGSQALGAETRGSHILHVRFTQPTPYFPGLAAFVTYRPIREDVFMRYGQRYAANADEMRYNGPFRLTEWVHGARLRLERNPEYWNAGEVELNAINVGYITNDPGALFNLFKDDKLALATLDTATMREALQRRMQIKRFLDGALFYVEFNHRPGRVTTNRNLRKAIQFTFDADEFVAKVIAIPGNEPARSLLPAWTRGVDRRFRDEHPPPSVSRDLVRANYHLDLARQALGVDEIPPLILLLSDVPTAVKQGEYLQNILSRHLGLDVKLDKQIFKQRLAKMSAGEFDMVSAGWGPDYDDPLTFADLFSSWNENNRGQYRNPEYDRLVRVAQRSSDPPIRNQAFADIQDIVINDAVVILQYERGSLYVQHPLLHGIRRQIFGGDPIYTYTRIRDQ